MTMFNKIVKEFKRGQHNVRLETGEIARQAGGVGIVDIEDTVVLATVVGAKTAKPGQDFFPLTVDYLEKTPRCRQDPVAFFRREGRPSEGETLDLAPDRPPSCPLFPEGFYNEVQVVIHVLSLNPEIPADIPALIGAAGGARCVGPAVQRSGRRCTRGLHQQRIRVEPDASANEEGESALDLIVAGT